MQKLIPALLMVLFAFASCTKSDDTQAKVVNDTWYVAFYEAPEPGTVTPIDNTPEFAGYTFEFNDDNEWVINSPANSTVNAYWSLENNGTTVKLKILDPDVVAPVDALVGTWDVLEQTNETLHLQKVPDVTQVDAAEIKIFFKKQ